MIDIKYFSDQHQELLNVAGQLAEKLDPDALAKDAWDARGLLSTLAGKLTVHLALEDRIVYPALLGSPDESVRELTQQFKTEMGGIAELFQVYVSNWPHAMAVESQPQKFIDETQAILTVLGERVENEEADLYPKIGEGNDVSKVAAA